MARPLRIEYEGAWYHVMNRGAGRRSIFPDRWLRRSFLGLVGDVHEMWGVEVHAYCLMGNHYHLLVRTPRANLGRAMRHLDGVFAQRYNRRLGTDGPLFRGRYKALVIEQEAYLLQVSRYVHRNPVEGGLCERVGDYPWSSYPAYVSQAPVPPWLYRDETLARFSSIGTYEAYMQEQHDHDLGATLESTGEPPVLGSATFVNSLVDEPGVVERYEVPQAGAMLRRSRRPMPMQAIIEIVAEHFGLPAPSLIEAKDRRARTARAMAMLLCRCCAGYGLREIGRVCSVERYTTVASAISRLSAKLNRGGAAAEDFDVLRRQIHARQISDDA